ncbi:hypothetical protein HCG51_27425 [Tolypothrix sp. PCC 7910]|uniref:hypothetical protein n=1 Tax=Tolypothrix sp. PCC 7910 TaxID=2099387 RepID=UPI0014278E6B|nr:hypothetical protein [Tolypothrix sp. PCC 7910]QIR40074.1 hypothetical protein HCG51_27425 [Tolypothrix sp. PCC 7910]
MKSCSACLAVFTASWGLFSINLVMCIPAQAAIFCETGTITNYFNDSLATCILSQDVSLQISIPKTGIFKFHCKAKNYIFLDEKGQLKSCQLAEEMKIVQSNSLETCPAEYRVDIAIAQDSSLVVDCQRY